MTIDQPAAARPTFAPLPPSEEAARALEQTRAALSQALTSLQEGDIEQVAHAYELTAECADHIARALWFLRRAEREGSEPPAPAAR